MAKRVDIVVRGLVDVGHGDIRNRSGECHGLILEAGLGAMEVCSSTEMGGNGRPRTQNRPKQTTISPGANELPSRDLPQLVDERPIANAPTERLFRFAGLLSAASHTPSWPA